MKRNVLKVLSLSALTLLIACGGEPEPITSDEGETKKEDKKEVTTEESEVEVKVETEAETTELDLSAGEEIYARTCVACHQANGEGIAGAFPPLAGSDYLLADKARAITQVKNGGEGEIVVNGETYNGVMTPQPLSNQEIADVLTYVYNSWGNSEGAITLEDVKAALGE